jgi:ABC-type Fe3+-hydroxamate transport system substrate-binding protein
VTWKHGAGVDTWQESTLLVGQALHREDKARQLVADTEARVARARAPRTIASRSATSA